MRRIGMRDAICQGIIGAFLVGVVGYAIASVVPLNPSALWLLFIAPVSLLAGGAVAVDAYRKDRRRFLGFCRMCGCDLRASPERCPECGNVVKA